MSGLNNPSSSASSLQPETQYYATKLGVNSGIVDAVILNALDRFVVKGKSDGWFSNIKMFAPMVGNNLPSALVKFITEPGGSDVLTNTNIVNSDYTPLYGVSLYSNSNKGLNTGVIPSAQGMTYQNMFIGVVCADPTIFTAGSGYPVADNPASGESTFYYNTNGALLASGVAFSFVNPAGRHVKLLNLNGASSAQLYDNGVISHDNTAALTANAYNTPITLFNNIRNGVLRYGTGNVGGLIMGTGLSKTQASLLNKALLQLYKDVSRIQNNGTIYYPFGDSITNGQGGTANTSYTSLVSAAMGWNYLNYGVPSGQLRQSNGLQAGGFIRYTDFLDQPFNVMTMMYGTNDMNIADAAANGTTSIINDYEAKLETIYAAFLAKGINLVVPSIIYGSTPNATKIGAYFAANYLAAKNQGVRFIDCYNIFLDTGSPGSYLADGLHPNAAGHALIANHLLAYFNGKRIYRDALIPATSVPAAVSGTPGTATFNVAMYGLKSGQQLLLGSPIVTTSGIIYTISYASDDNVTVTMSNTTNAAITTNQTNLRITFLVD